MLVVQNRLIAPTALKQRIEQGFTHATPNLKSLKGFVSFKLIRAEGQPEGVNEGEVLYIAQTIWQDRDSYENWRAGDSFTAAHTGPNAGQPSPLRSSLEIFEVILETV